MMVIIETYETKTQFHFIFLRFFRLKIPWAYPASTLSIFSIKGVPINMGIETNSKPSLQRISAVLSNFNGQKNYTCFSIFFTNVFLQNAAWCSITFLQDKHDIINYNTVCNKKTNKFWIELKQMDHSFPRYPHTNSKNQNRHWIPMFIGTPCTLHLNT